MEIRKLRGIPVIMTQSIDQVVESQEIDLELDPMVPPRSKLGILRALESDIAYIMQRYSIPQDVAEAEANTENYLFSHNMKRRLTVRTPIAEFYWVGEKCKVSHNYD